MKDSELISVILPCYNAIEYLKEALDSILNQSYTNLEIITIDDGSSDGTLKYLQNQALKDLRIRVISNEKNLGLIKTLNKAINLAQGDYIARMDADDISHPERIEKLFDFLQKTDSDVVSCNFDYLKEDGNFFKTNTLKAISYEEIFLSSFLFTPICHPGLVARKKVFINNVYSLSDSSIHTEDYELWSRMARKNVKFQNLNEKLYSFRINSASVSHKFEDLQKDNFASCAQQHYNLYFKTDISLEIYRIVVNRFNSIKKNELKKAFSLIDDLVGQSSLDSRKSIKTIGQLQKMDILIQAVRLEKMYLFNLLQLIFSNIGNSVFRKALLKKL